MNRALAPLAAASAVAGAVLAAPAAAEPVRHAIDPSHAVVAFMVDHVGYARVLGTFGEIEGGFAWDPEARELGELRVVVGTASVSTGHDRRDDHVRGGDFLDVKEHPEMVFTVSGPVAVPEDSVRLEGELSLLGQTLPLALDVTLNKAAEYPFGHGKETLGLSARGTVRRSDYGMEYAVANGLVGDEVELIIEIEALRE